MSQWLIPILFFLMAARAVPSNAQRLDGPPCEHDYPNATYTKDASGVEHKIIRVESQYNDADVQRVTIQETDYQCTGVGAAMATVQWKLFSRVNSSYSQETHRNSPLPGNIWPGQEFTYAFAAQSLKLEYYASTFDPAKDKPLVVLRVDTSKSVVALPQGDLVDVDYTFHQEANASNGQTSMNHAHKVMLFYGGGGDHPAPDDFFRSKYDRDTGSTFFADGNMHTVNAHFFRETGRSMDFNDRSKYVGYSYFRSRSSETDSNGNVVAKSEDNLDAIWEDPGPWRFSIPFGQDVDRATAIQKLGKFVAAEIFVPHDDDAFVWTLHPF